MNEENLKSDEIIPYTWSKLFLDLINGNFGLVKTYWLFGVAVSAIYALVTSLLTSPEVITISLVIFLIYQIPVTIGIWHSATKYSGAKSWAVLAKVLAVFNALVLIRISTMLLGISE